MRHRTGCSTSRQPCSIAISTLRGTHSRAPVALASQVRVRQQSCLALDLADNLGQSGCIRTEGAQMVKRLGAEQDPHNFANIAVPVDVEADAVAVPVDGDAGAGKSIRQHSERVKTVAFTQIGVGRPLSIKIVSIYPGDDPERGRQALLTSAVRSPLINDAKPWAIHYMFDGISFSQLLLRRADLPGSQVVYYNPAELRPSLDITLRFAFDRFDADMYQAWLDAAADVASLPAFALAGTPGTVGVGLARRIGKLVLGFFDRHIDGKNDSYMSWTLNLEEAGHPRDKAGFVAFFPDEDNDDERVIPLGPGVSAIPSRTATL